ncbi:hypothetical protein [Palleronia sp.]|uniref:hypothetical protein n=1 Tax=Palleronia sp. TaxID=1940284 RepID=UPI0035C818F7
MRDVRSGYPEFPVVWNGIGRWLDNEEGATSLPGSKTAEKINAIGRQIRDLRSKGEEASMAEVRRLKNKRKSAGAKGVPSLRSPVDIVARRKRPNRPKKGLLAKLLGRRNN